SRGLAEVNVPEANVGKRAEMAREPRHGLEEFERLVDRQIEDVRYRVTLVEDLERFPVVALPMADLAGDINVRQEVHLDLHQAVTLASLTSAALHVEGEPAGRVPAHAALGQVGEQLPDDCEQPGVRCRVRPRRASDRGLIDVYDLVDELQARHPVMNAGNEPGPVEPPR